MVFWETKEINQSDKNLFQRHFFLYGLASARRRHKRESNGLDRVTARNNKIVLDK